MSKCFRCSCCFEFVVILEFIRQKLRRNCKASKVDVLGHNAGLSFVPQLNGVSSFLRNEGMADIEKCMEAFERGEMESLKRYATHTKFGRFNQDLLVMATYIGFISFCIVWSLAFFLSYIHILVSKLK